MTKKKKKETEEEKRKRELEEMLKKMDDYSLLPLGEKKEIDPRDVC